jgi:hypothetical protein
MEMSENIFLASILGILYCQNGNYHLSLRNLELLKGTVCDEDPFYYFQHGLIFLLKSLSRKVDNKESYLIKANEYFDYYAMRRKRFEPLEVLFNMARFYQFIGHDKLASDKYNTLLSKTLLRKNPNREKLYLSSVYNYAMMIKKNGNDKEAHKLIRENIIID